MGYNHDFGDTFWTRKAGNCVFFIQNCLVLKVNVSKIWTEPK